MSEKENFIVEFNKRTLKFVLIIYMISTVASFISYFMLKVLKINDDISPVSLVILGGLGIIYGVIFYSCYSFTNKNNKFNLRAFEITKNIILILTYFHYLYLNFTMHMNSQWLLIIYFTMLCSLFFDVRLIIKAIGLAILSIAAVFIRDNTILFGKELVLADLILKIICIVLVFVGLAIMVFFASKLLNEIDNKEKILKNENGKLLNLFDKIREISAVILQSSENLGTAISEQTTSLQEVAVTSQSLSDDSNSMLNKSSENKEILDSLLSANKVVNDKTQHNKNAIEEFMNITEENKENLNNTLEVIKDIDENIESTFLATKELKDKSSEVDNILNLIRGISEQTNLLALNASIEAAKSW